MGFIRAVIGMAIGLVSVVAPAWGLFHLLRTPSCGTDGIVVVGPPCPDELALWIVGIVVSLTVLAPMAIFIAGRQGTDRLVLLVPICWLVPFGMVAGAIVSGLGPSSDPDTRWIAIIGAAIVALIGLRVLAGFARRGRRRRQSPAAAAFTAPTSGGSASFGGPAPPPATPATASIATLHQQLSQIAEAARTSQSDDLAARLRKIDELRAAGTITAAEHAARRREILDEI